MDKTTDIPDAVFGFLLPAGMPCVWSARAIYSTRPEISIDFVPERMHTYGDKDGGEARILYRWLNKTAIPELRTLCIEMHIAVDDYRHIEYRNDGHIIRATPNGSHGYLYVVGHPLQHP